jgi:hypothetical protein
MKIGIEEIYLNIIKAIYNKPIANIILKVKLFPLRVRQACPLSPLIQNSLWILSQSNKARERNKSNRNRKEFKLSLFTDNVILYLPEPKDFAQNSLRSDKNFQQNSSIQNQNTVSSGFSLYQSWTGSERKGENNPIHNTL